MLQLHRSNRTEALVDALASLYATPLGGPLDPEWLVVQGRGMATWLAMELSRRLGVWADGAALYPRNFVRRVLALGLGEQRAAAAERYAPDSLAWTIAALLPAHLADPELARVAHYLGGAASSDVGNARRFQLARQIADVFDRYLTYRPDLLLGWERGDDRSARAEGEAWQALLWRAVVARLGPDHVASLERALGPALAAAELPERVAVFGLATLPPLYARVLCSVARHAEVHVFSLSPSREHWTEAAMWARRDGEPGDAATENPLLASLGLVGAETEHVLGEAALALEIAEREHDRYLDPDATSELGRVQADILALRTSAPGAPDGSIAIHACHGPMREVEVLRDQLLERFARGELRPHEVVVMMPDIEAYAPLVEAVFERAPDDAGFIPYRIADRALAADSPLIDAFFRVLDLAGGRFTAPEVVDLLSLAPIQRRFSIGAEDVEPCAEWLAASGVRWGIDAAHRAAHGQPSDAHNTWRFGLDRLLVGYALPSDGRSLDFGILPCDEIEGQEAALLGRLSRFCETLFTAVRGLETAQTFLGWQERLGGACDELFAAERHEAWQTQRIRDGLAELTRRAAAADFDETVGVEVVRELLSAIVDERHPERGFLAGGVTFCAMVPMRTIPFQLVCLLGLSDGAFPRPERAIEIDLGPRLGRRPGDRSRRDDDRYLFLEAILSARRGLYLSYVGSSIRDNAALPPSPVLGDLCDYLGGGAERVVRHRLQPFSRAYFDGSDARLFSYEPQFAAGAEASAARATAAPRLFDRELPPVEPAAELALAELERFFKQPVRHLLEQRLNVDLGARAAQLVGEEPLEPSGLEGWRLGQRLLDWMVADVAPEGSRELLRAEGLLPPGPPGDRLHDQKRAEVAPLAAAVREHEIGTPLRPVLLDARLPDGTRLRGEIGDLWRGGMVRRQWATLKAKNVLCAWIAHLGQCVARGAAAQPSALIGRVDGEVVVRRFRVAHDAAALLADLVALYRDGAARPLSFFPGCSQAYLDALRKTGSAARALDRAESAWKSEIQFDDYLARAFSEFPGRDDPSFAELCVRVLDPMREHLE